jgi:four helix bundle protein
MRDAARAAKQNIREGYRRGSLGEFIQSQGSLEELSGHIEDCLEDRFITKEVFSEFNKLYRSADYLSTRYLKALYLIEKKGTWKTIGKYCLG